MIYPIRIAALALLILLGLTACAPHPGAGNWQVAEASGSPFSRINVHFEGKAELIDASSGAETHHCFWGRKSSSEIQLDCTTAEDTETRLHYTLEVLDGESAMLHHAGQQLGLFSRLPRDTADQ